MDLYPRQSDIQPVDVDPAQARLIIDAMHQYIIDTVRLGSESNVNTSAGMANDNEIYRRAESIAAAMSIEVRLIEQFS